MTINDIRKESFKLWYIYIYISWSTAVEGYPKAPSSIATTPRCWGWHNSFPWITPLTLDLYLIMLSVKYRGIKYNFFESLIRLDVMIVPQSPRPLANIVTMMATYIVIIYGYHWLTCWVNGEPNYVVLLHDYYAVLLHDECIKHKT